MNCPLDNSPLITKMIGGSTCKTCKTCGGIWLPGQAVDRIIGRKDIGHAIENLNRGYLGKLKCPEGHSELLVLIRKTVEIDICTKCNGIWLDKGELTKLGEDESLKKPIPKETFTNQDATGWFVWDVISQILTGFLP